jgi:glycerol-3-phosphate O-acyltransferase
VSENPVLNVETGTGSESPILFIVDAQNRLEKRLLDQWLSDSYPAAYNSRLAQQIFLPISKDYERLDSAALIEKLDSPKETQLVPVRVAWSLPGVVRDMGKPVTLRYLLFGDPRRPGAFRGRMILRRDPDRAQCIAGAPATIAELRARFAAGELGTTADNRNKDFAAFVARQAGLALEIAEWKVIGRRYKVPRYVGQGLRSNPKFKESLKELSLESGRSIDELNRETNDYVKELVAVPNAFFVDLRARFENFVLSLGYNKEVEFQEDDLEWLREILQSKPTVLLFTHKTYIDSMALTSTLFENDFPMVHIFGGINMSFAGLGLLLRRSGGIFIRRSFQGKPLYKTVLRHYIGYLLEKRFPMTWAFEGTRSRTGKLMPPRYGLLKYVVEAAHTTDARNLHVIPVAVSYDLMRDVEEYTSEQAGRVKKPESLKWFIGYLSSLRQPMGRMYLDFGEPVVLERAPDPEDRLALFKIAFEVAVQANKVTPITLPAVTCMVLLGAAPRALTIEELQTETLMLIRWALTRGIRLTSDFRPERLAHVRKLADTMVDMGLLIRYDEGTDTVFGIEPAQHPVASYYRNTIIHHFVNKAILELALLTAVDASDGEASRVFWKETARLRDFFKFEFFYPKKKRFKLELEQELKRIDPDWEQRLEKGAREIQALLDELGPQIAHATLLTFVEAYSVVFDLLARLDEKESLEESDCVSMALKAGRQAYLQRRITSEASIGKILFQNGFKLAQNLGLTDGGGEDIAARRIRLLRDFKELSVRLERIRLLDLSSHSDPVMVKNNATA